MFKNNFLGLSGFGYLQGIRRCHNGKMYIKLNIITGSEGSQSDEIWVECQVNISMFPAIAILEHLLARSRTIILKFDAKYSAFRQSYSGMTENDPDFIVQIHGQLLNIHEFYVKRNNTSYRYKNGIKNNMVSHKTSALTL
jgi:hypothetical protein